jgi:hypothetical protein
MALLYEGLDDIRVVQTTAADVEVSLIKNESFTTQGFRAARETLLNLLDGTNVKFTFVDQIPPTLSGKRRVIVNESGLTAQSLWKGAEALNGVQH